VAVRSGTAEKMAGKVARDPGMQARGEERKVSRSEDLSDLETDVSRYSQEGLY
jgi:hypothetical protein